MRQTHELKIWPIFFDQVQRGRKNFELRNTKDRHFQEHDFLILKEWDPDTEQYTGRELERVVQYIYTGDGLTGVQENFSILSLKPEHPAQVYIFKMNECDYVAAHNLDDAKKCLSEMVHDGTVDAQFEDEFLDNPHSLDYAEMTRLKLTDEDDMNEAMQDHEGDKTGDEWKERQKKYLESCPSFNEALTQRLNVESPPFHFASSEY